MSHQRNWIAVTVVILGLLMFIPVAQAQRQDFESRLCAASTYNVVHFTPEWGIGSYDQRGIIQSTHESKLFDNWTQHLVAVQKRVGGKYSWNGFSKETGPDGEFIIWEIDGDSESGTISKPILGTGKWKGVKGERKSIPITTAKPILPSTFQPHTTFQFCLKGVGWIELQK